MMDVSRKDLEGGHLIVSANQKKTTKTLDFRLDTVLSSTKLRSRVDISTTMMPTELQSPTIN